MWPLPITTTHKRKLVFLFLYPANTFSTAAKKWSHYKHKRSLWEKVTLWFSSIQRRKRDFMKHKTFSQNRVHHNDARPTVARGGKKETCWRNAASYVTTCGAYLATGNAAALTQQHTLMVNGCCSASYAKGRCQETLLQKLRKAAINSRLRF